MPINLEYLVRFVFEHLDHSSQAGYFKVSIIYTEESKVVDSSPFIVVIASTIQILSNAHPLYFDKNGQTVEVSLKDSSNRIPFSSIKPNSPTFISYSWIYLDSSEVISFSTRIFTSYPNVKFYTIEWDFLNIDSSIQPTKLYVVKNFILGDSEYNFISNTIPIVVETQPIINDILPSNYYRLAESGDITLLGTFDDSRTLYLRITFYDKMNIVIIPSSSITPTEATFYIDKTYVPAVGEYTLEISYYEDLFCKYLPLQIYKWDMTDVLENWLTTSLYVVSGPAISEAFPLTIPANTAGQFLTLKGENLTSYTFCEIGGINIATTLVNGEMLRWEIPQGNFGDVKLIKLVERELFLSDTGLSIQYTEPLVITGIEPTVVFMNYIKQLESSSETVKILIENLPSISGSINCIFDSVTLQSIGTGITTSGTPYILCPLPLFPSSSISTTAQVSLSSCDFSPTSCLFTPSLSSTFCITSSSHALTFLTPPSLQSILPTYLPRTSSLLTLTASNLSPSITYSCLFYYGFSTVEETPATYMDSSTLQWITIGMEKESYVKVGLKAESGGIYSMGYGYRNLVLYELVEVKRMTPSYADFGEILNVAVTLGGCDQEWFIGQLPFLENVRCRFGNYDATTVKVYKQGRLVVCTKPVITSSDAYEEVKMKVSIDGLNWFESDQTFTLFAIPTFTGVDSLKIPLLGKPYIKVIGTNFYNSGSYLACRLKISSNEYFDMKTELVSDTEIRCLNPPPYVIPITGISLSVTFNRQTFYSVSSTLEYANAADVYSIDKFYGIQEPISNIITATGVGFTNATYASVGFFAEDLAFTPTSDTLGTFELPTYVNISAVTDNPYTYLWYFDEDDDIERYCSGDLTTDKYSWWFFGASNSVTYSYMVVKDSIGWVCIDRYPKQSVEIGIPEIGYSRNGISYQYLPAPQLSEMEPKAVFENTATTLLIKGAGFWNTDTLLCRVRVNSSTYIYLSTTYVNSTSIKCDFPETADTSATYSLSVTLNGYEYVANEIPFSVNLPIDIFSVFPVVMFKNQENVEIFVLAEPIPAIGDLSCIVHEFVIEGEKIEDNGNIYVKCIIPSYEAIANSALIPVPSNGEVVVTLQIDGVKFSNAGVVFRFLDTNQVNGITPLNGPDTGGTNITIELSIDQTTGDIGEVYCLFWRNVAVLAIASPPEDYIWVTPKLDTTIWESAYDWYHEFSLK
jgi:hypothetical protein